MTEFNLLRAKSDGQLFVHIHTERSTYIVQVDENELTELRGRLDNPPEPVDR